LENQVREKDHQLNAAHRKISDLQERFNAAQRNITKHQARLEEQDLRDEAVQLQLTQ
jgi:chromosome segregation ATPase